MKMAAKWCFQDVIVYDSSVFWLFSLCVYNIIVI